MRQFIKENSLFLIVATVITVLSLVKINNAQAQTPVPHRIISCEVFNPVFRTVQTRIIETIDVNTVKLNGEIKRPSHEFGVGHQRVFVSPSGNAHYEVMSHPTHENKHRAFGTRILYVHQLKEVYISTLHNNSRWIEVMQGSCRTKDIYVPPSQDRTQGDIERELAENPRPISNPDTRLVDDLDTRCKGSIGFSANPVACTMRDEAAEEVKKKQGLCFGVPTKNAPNPRPNWYKCQFIEQ